ncbi:hypothetical protein ZIOFF_057759 [Zingiber officinale]|uniref:DUF7796 domain-containing protein n=1 Tax=Zingiber officinale TaxID=94328 RepID=A0A8J5FCZ2_ZINOF|nr:hypothetical protein ZIOFF_057759 [Zingiber officinale]
MVLTGSWYGGLNDRLNASNQVTSKFAFSCLSLIPHLYAIGYRRLNLELVFQAQLAVENVTWEEVHILFYVVSKRQYEYPPQHYDILVCTEEVVAGLDQVWRWMEWRNFNNLEVCNGSTGWANNRRAKVGCSEEEGSRHGHGLIRSGLRDYEEDDRVGGVVGD